ncbi:hypothetical protein PI23P_08315 [Polaribacter irgensii 23-P]|uniref:Uncharacterized protein n=1 Tax=Polaribacter irgensii 23-P TaxID=313594 RepID=A4BZM2_9FLAO|nr:hypothetical protein PI23P_08315 [Polaribacter irgensii 23-P]
MALNTERTNWWFSIFTIILDLIISGSPKIYKRKAKLNLKILLIDIDLEKAKKITYLLNDHKTYTQHRL